MDQNPYPSTPRFAEAPLHMLRYKELLVLLETDQTSLPELVPLHGDLSRDTLGDAIRSLYVNRRSGILHLAQEKVSKRIYFRKGSMIFANSDVETDRLG